MRVAGLQLQYVERCSASETCGFAASLQKLAMDLLPSATMVRPSYFWVKGCVVAATKSLLGVCIGSEMMWYALHTTTSI